MVEDPDEPRTLRPEACRTMADVRREVDRIDRLLVKVLAERQALMETAARIKSQRAAVRDAERIEDVVAKVLAAAERAGLSAAIAEPVWRLLIERCIAHEFDAWDARANAKVTPSSSEQGA